MKVDPSSGNSQPVSRASEKKPVERVERDKPTEKVAEKREASQARSENRYLGKA